METTWMGGAARAQRTRCVASEGSEGVRVYLVCAHPSTHTCAHPNRNIWGCRNGVGQGPDSCVSPRTVGILVLARLCVCACVCVCARARARLCVYKTL